MLTAFFSAVTSGLVIAFGTSTLPSQSRATHDFQHSHPGAWLVPRSGNKATCFDRWHAA